MRMGDALGKRGPFGEKGTRKSPVLIASVSVRFLDHPKRLGVGLGRNSYLLKNRLAFSLLALFEKIGPTKRRHRFGFVSIFYPKITIWVSNLFLRLVVSTSREGHHRELFLCHRLVFSSFLRRCSFRVSCSGQRFWYEWLHVLRSSF